MFSVSSVLKVLLLTVAVCSAADDGWSLVGRVWSDCRTGGDTLSCLRGRALAALDRAVRADVRISDNVILQRTREDSSRALTPEEIEAPDSAEGLFFDRLARFFSSHVLKIELPKVTPAELQNGVEEGRGKMKKMMGSMMMMGAMKAAMVIPMVMGGLFLLAGKAFIIAKIALVLALVITAKKLFGQKDDGGHSGGHGGGWDRRSLSSHDIVYAAYRPDNLVKTA